MPVVLLSGFPLMRAGLRELVEAAGLEVAGEATDVEATLELVRGRDRTLVVADTDLARSPTEIVRRLRSHDSSPHVVVLGSSTGAAALAALRAGACGYFPKTASRDELAAGLRAAAARPVPARPAEMRIATPLREHAPADGDATLSTREIEVLQLVVCGRDNAEIAAELCISPATAKSHVSHILRKLRAQNRIQAAVYAVRAGIA